MTFITGQRVRWNGTPCQVVDPTDPKLYIARPFISGLVLIVAHNGQLVWVRESDLTDDEQGVL